MVAGAHEFRATSAVGCAENLSNAWLFRVSGVSSAGLIAFFIDDVLGEFALMLATESLLTAASAAGGRLATAFA
jgi:hypothetical protein